MYKVDLHTHSTASRDGGIKSDQYAKVLESGLLDFIAVTDHDTVHKAQELRRTFGDRIIVGEEITTTHGEVIGLFLQSVIKPGQTIYQTIQAIKAQNGLVYIPHPFETLRKGLREEDLDAVSELVDIIEVKNARAVFHDKGPQAATWAHINRKPATASSDAHGIKGLGGTYCYIKEQPRRDNLVSLLNAGRIYSKRPPLYSLLYPKYHRVKRKLSLHHE